VAGYSFGLNRAVGILLVLGMIGYIFLAYRQERQGAAHSAGFDKAAALEEFDPGLTPREDYSGSLLVALLFFFAGMALIVTGGRVLVDVAIEIASELGVSDEVIFDSGDGLCLYRRASFAPGGSGSYRRLRLLQRLYGWPELSRVSRPLGSRVSTLAPRESLC